MTGARQASNCRLPGSCTRRLGRKALRLFMSFRPERFGKLAVGRKCPRIEQAELSQGAAQENHKRVRLDLRAIDRGIPSHQIGSHQDIGSVPGGALLRGSLLCTVEAWR